MVPTVAILMGCYNGAEYLAEQLDSLKSQTHTNWCLYASVDGSIDGTLEILQAYQERWGVDKLIIRQGPRQGFCKNFLSLACDPSIKADYYAFCDQDDVWLPEKIKAAVDCLSSKNNRLPLLYGSRTTYVNQRLEPLGMSAAFQSSPSLGNALVQSIAGGNTLLFNSKTKELLNKSGIVDVISHDWWLYILVEAAGGEVYFDQESYVLYRQHGNSIVGENTGLKAKWHRFAKLIAGDFRGWNSQNLNALHKNKALISSQAIFIIRGFESVREGGILQRILGYKKYGLYRQGYLGAIGLLVAVLFKKI